MENKNIALISHNDKKLDMVKWCIWNKDILQKNNLVGTATTGKVIEKEVGLKVQKVASGVMGGDAQISAMMVENKLDFVVFFIDPLSIPPHFEDVRAFIRLAILYDIPIAFNKQTADAIITSNIFN